MANLVEIQKLFAQAVYGEDNSGIVALLKPGKISPEDMISIYHDNVHISLRENLSAKFPLLERIVDSRFFVYLSHEYAKKYPSMSGNLDDFGGMMGEFVASFNPTKSMHYLVDIARIEWAIHMSYRAKDLNPISYLEIINFDKNLKLLPHPSLFLIRSNYAIDELIENIDADSRKEIDIFKHKTNIIVARPEFDVLLHFINDQEADLVEKIINNELTITGLLNLFDKESIDNFLKTVPSYCQLN